MIFKILVFLNLLAIIASSSEVIDSEFSENPSNRIPVRVILLKWKDYIREVTQEFIYELEEFGLCNIFLQDFQQNISRTDFFGHEVVGVVNYINGFMGTLQIAEIKQSSETFTITEANSESVVKCLLIFNDLKVFFDFHANVTSGMESGTVEIPVKNIEFDLRVMHSYETNLTNGYIHSIANSGGVDKNSKWMFEPSTVNTQIIHREITWTVRKDLDILTNTTLLNLLENVIKRKKYPEICFNCNSLTDN